LIFKIFIIIRQLYFNFLLWVSKEEIMQQEVNSGQL